MLIALTLPITFHMTPLHATTLLVAMYVGSITGGLITATLLRMPGSPAAVMTTLDGYPLAKSGQPGRALGLGITASVFGSLVSWLALATFTQPLSELAVQLTPFNFFALVMMAMVLIASVAGGDMFKGLVSGFLGMLATFPGVDPAGGEMRLLFGMDDLVGGFKLLPVLIGVFAVSQIFADALDMKVKPELVAFTNKGIFMSLSDLRAQAVNLVRSSFIGTVIGILPGVGGVGRLGNRLPVRAARLPNAGEVRQGIGGGDRRLRIRQQRHGGRRVNPAHCARHTRLGYRCHPDRCADDPRNPAGASVVHDQPRNRLERDRCRPGGDVCHVRPDAGAGRFYVRVSTIPKVYLLPLIMVFCVVGVFSLNNTMFDVWTMLGFGVLGFLMERAGYSLGPFVIGFVLARVAEVKLRQGLQFSDGDIAPLFTDPLSLLLLLIALALFVWSLRAERKRSRQGTLSALSSETRR